MREFLSGVGVVVAASSISRGECWRERGTEALGHLKSSRGAKPHHHGRHCSIIDHLPNRERPKYCRAHLKRTKSDIKVAIAVSNADSGRDSELE